MGDYNCQHCKDTKLVYDIADLDPVEGYKMADRKLPCPSCPSNVTAFRVPVHQQIANDLKADKSFADAPVSVTEIRSDRSSDARDWTPRDVLVQLLREIDSGQRDVSSLFVGWREEFEHDGRRTCDHKFSRAGGQSIFDDVGLVEGIKFQMLTS